MPMEITGTSNTYFAGTDITPYSCFRDGVATVTYAAIYYSQKIIFFYIEIC